MKKNRLPVVIILAIVALSVGAVYLWPGSKLSLTGVPVEAVLRDGSTGEAVTITDEESLQRLFALVQDNVFTKARRQEQKTGWTYYADITWESGEETRITFVGSREISVSPIIPNAGNRIIGGSVIYITGHDVDLSVLTELHAAGR